MDLFSVNEQKIAPLADRMRPQTLDEFLGQKHIVGKGMLLRRAMRSGPADLLYLFRPARRRKNDAGLYHCAYDFFCF